jgi:hypothetical protein
VSLLEEATMTPRARLDLQCTCDAPACFLPFLARCMEAARLTCIVVAEQHCTKFGVRISDPRESRASPMLRVPPTPRRQHTATKCHSRSLEAIVLCRYGCVLTRNREIDWDRPGGDLGGDVTRTCIHASTVFRAALTPWVHRRVRRARGSSAHLLKALA